MALTTNLIFPILGFEEKAELYYTVGTAFFINDTGTFVTAAHTFNTTKDCTFFALINRNTWPVSQIFSEYAEMWNQKPPIHLDLYIGQVDLKEKTPFYSFVKSDILKYGNSLNFSGFASEQYSDQIDYPDPPIIQTKPINSMDDLWEDELNASLNWPNVAECLNKLRTSYLTGIFTGQGFEKLHEIFNIQGTFTNGFSFRLTNTAISPKGLSGGPVIYDGNVAGMLIAKNGAIRSEYIIDKLNEIGIDHTLVDAH